MQQLFEADHSPALGKCFHIKPDCMWSFPAHSHDDCVELSFAVAGKSVCYCEGIRYVFQKDMVFIKNRGMIHSEMSDHEDPVDELDITLHGVHVKGFAPDCIVSDSSHSMLYAGDYSDILKESFRLIVQKQGSSDVRNILINAVIGMILDLENSGMFIPAEPSDGKSIIEDVRRYIDTNFSRRISLGSLSENFFMSEFYLDRQFRKYTGKQLKQYLIERRMGEAQKLLAFDDCGVNEIADRCGYSSANYFCQAFRKYSGMTPAQFREKYRHAAEIGNTFK